MDKVAEEASNRATPQKLDQSCGCGTGCLAEQKIPFDSLPLEEKIKHLYVGMTAQNKELTRTVQMLHKTIESLSVHTHAPNGEAVVVRSTHSIIYGG